MFVASSIFPDSGLSNHLLKNGRFYYNPGKPLRAKRLSTDFFIYPHDLYNEVRLNEIINRNLRYSGSIEDDENMAALSAIPPSVPDNYVLLGLYLFFASITSLCSQRTFLSGCRDVNLSKKNGDNQTEEFYYQKLLEVLEYLTINTHTTANEAAEEFYKYGTFTVNGERNFVFNPNIEIINALRNIPPYKPEDGELAKLYMYLMNRSISTSFPTFEDAAISSGLTKMPQASVDREIHYQKLIDTIDKLGMTHCHDINNLIKTYYETGKVVINDPYYDYPGYDNINFNGISHIGGSFAFIAHKISTRNNTPFLNINDAIGFAVGTKPIIQNLPEGILALHEYIRSISTDTVKISELIERGHSIRYERTRADITFNSIGIERPSFAIDEDGAKFFEAVIKQQPSDISDLIRISKYGIAYCDGDFLTDILPDWTPENKPAHMSDADLANVQTSAAVRFSKYRMLLVCRGKTFRDYSDDDLINGIAQRITHEMIHEALNSELIKDISELYGSLDHKRRQAGDKGSIGKLMEQAIEVAKYIQSERKTNPSFDKIFQQKTLITNRPELWRVINPIKFDGDTYTIEQWKEEVLCNLYGLLYTEFSPTNCPVNNPFFDTPCTSPELAEKLKPTRDLASNLIDTIHKISEIYRNKEMQESQGQETSSLRPR